MEINLKEYIKSIPDFPKEGIMYRDIQPLLSDNTVFNYAIRNMLYGLKKIPEYFVGIEARGFIFASGMSVLSGAGFKMIRKAGKLPPNDLNSIEYGLEYGRDEMQIEKGSGQIVLVDDIYATGGTMAAAEILAETSGYEVIQKVCLLDIGLIKKHDTKCLIYY